MKIASRRSLEIGTIIAAAAAEGIPAAVCTNTVRHHKGQKLAFVWDGVAVAWNRASTGREFSQMRAEYGIEGFIRAQECTHGVNGFHPHTHSVWIGEGFTDDQAVDDFFEPMWERWSRGAIAAGLSAPTIEGQEWHLLDGDFADTQMAEYLSTAKAFGVTSDTAKRIGMELTQTQSKTATGIYKTVPVWDLLTAANWGEVGPARLWHEFEKASKGRRQINYSRGLRKRFGIEQPEKTDEQIAAEELGVDQDTIVWIERLGWARLLELGLVHTPLDIAEQSGQMALCQWLQEHDIDHRRV